MRNTNQKLFSPAPSKPNPGTISSGVLPFWRFCKEVLNIDLTPGQLVVSKVCIDGIAIVDLSHDERGLAVSIFGFGDTTNIPRKARKTICLRFGRGSGKTSWSSWVAIYKAFTADVSKCGRGDIPTVAIIAPDKATARDLCLHMVRENLRQTPKLEVYVEGGDTETVSVRRPDGVLVNIKAFAADKGGKTIRGRSIIAAILDEAEFFDSDPDGRYMVNDRDVFRAIRPRLLPDGKVIFISTPWPSENLMSKLIEENFGKPVSALCAIAPTGVMRTDRPDMLESIEEERQRDPENAAREYDCDVTLTKAGTFFDQGQLTRSINEFTPEHSRLFPVAAAADFGFRRDSSALAIVQWDGSKYNLLRLVEVIPKNGKPLVPSEVVKEFSDTLKEFGVKSVIADSFYRESIREMLRTHEVGIIDAPEGAKGKMEVYVRTKACLDQGILSIPNNARFLKQAREITAKPTSGGMLTIKSPRRMGQGHGDLVSAWTNAVHYLANSSVKTEPYKLKFGESGYMDWIRKEERRLEQEREDRFLSGGHKRKVAQRYN